MKNATLLVVVGRSADPADLAQILRSAAASKAHLSVLILASLPRTPIFAYGIEPYGIPTVSDTLRDDIEATRTDLAATKRAIEAALSASGTSGDVDSLSCEPGLLPSIIGRRAATCDAVLVSNDLRDDQALFRNAVHGALFDAPAGVILNGLRRDDVLHPDRIFVAWDTSLPAARATHLALPLLKRAAQTTIGIFDPVTSAERDGENPGSDVARWLSHHGCRVTLQQFPSGGEEIGTCILRRGAEFGADLVVMGAYGHSRMRQAVFGGTTRTLIEQMEMPVLLGH